MNKTTILTITSLILYIISLTLLVIVDWKIALGVFIFTMAREIEKEIKK